MAAPRNYWMVAVNSAYYQAWQQQDARDSKVLAMGKAQRKRVQRMEIGDRILFYVHDQMVFPATASIASTYFEDSTPLFPSPEPDEPLAWRVKTKPECLMNEEHFIDARLIAPRMEYVKKWAPEQWPLAFQGLLHLIPKKDFQLIEDEMRRGKKTPKIDLPGYHADRFAALSSAGAGAGDDR